ncbi:hypothetical protein NO393_17915 [Escherichia coli]|nr:hypothetical protein [Escherichia coli]
MSGFYGEAKCWTDITKLVLVLNTKKRIIAVNAALEIIKATLSAPTDAKNVDFDLGVAAKHIAPLADAIQAAIDKE